MLQPRSKLLDCRSPIEWSHPLNRGLVAEWAAVPLPGWARATPLRNLVRGGKSFTDGTINGGVTWSAFSRNGGYGSLNNDGTGYVDCGSSAALSFNSNFTLACWLNLASAAGATGQGLISHGTGAYYFRACGDSSTALELIRSNQANLLTANTALSTGVWHFGAVSYTSGNSATIYLDGKADGTASSLSLSSPTFNLVLSADNNSGVIADKMASGGKLDSAMIYNRALSSSEVEWLYAETRAGNPNRWRWIEFGGRTVSLPANFANVWLLKA
jgi:hypothetical protein